MKFIQNLYFPKGFPLISFKVSPKCVFNLKTLTPRMLRQQIKGGIKSLELFLSAAGEWLSFKRQILSGVSL